MTPRERLSDAVDLHLARLSLRYPLVAAVSCYVGFRRDEGWRRDYTRRDALRLSYNIYVSQGARKARAREAARRATL